jgi:hypothetical protein
LNVLAINYPPPFAANKVKNNSEGRLEEDELFIAQEVVVTGEVDHNYPE